MSTQTDSAGTVFDPALHQVRGGVPLVRKTDGRFVLKGKRGAVNGKGKAQLEAKREKRAQTADNAPASAQTAPDSVKGLPPLETPKASASDLLGEFAKPTIEPGAPDEPEKAPETEGEAAAADVSASQVAADAPARAAPGDLTDEGMSHMAVEVFVAYRQAGIDAKEWDVPAEEKADVAASITKLLRKHDINPGMSEEVEVLVKIFAMHAKRAALPKTAAWLAGLWKSFKGLFVRKKPPVAALPDKPDKPQPKAVEPAPKAETPPPAPEAPKPITEGDKLRGILG